MGGCCSKSTATNDQQTDLKSLPPPHEKKKEIFVIKHRISHDDATLNTTSSSKEEEFDERGSRLRRSNSTSRPHNPNRKRRSCRSNSSFDFDFDLNTRFNNLYYGDDEDHRHRVGRARGVSATRNNSSRSSSKERRISISPSRTTRSESPFRNLKRPPVKMVSVPATYKQEEVVVKRIHVKRNVSPAKTSLAAADLHRTSTTNTSEVVDQLRKSLVEIDNNADTSTQQHRKDMNPGPPSYASLLLEDIHKFHQKAAPPAFVLPECVAKARSIMEAVAHLNSNTSSLCSDDRYRNLTVIEHQMIKPIESGTVVNASVAGDQQPPQAKPSGRFHKDFMDYPRHGRTCLPNPQWQL